VSVPLVCLTVRASLIAMWAQVLAIGEFYRRRSGGSAGPSPAAEVRVGEPSRSLARRRDCERDLHQLPLGRWRAFAGTQAPGPAGCLSVHDVAAMLELELMTEAQSL